MVHDAGTAERVVDDRRNGLGVPPASFMFRLRHARPIERGEPRASGLHDGKVMYVLPHRASVEDERPPLAGRPTPLILDFEVGRLLCKVTGGQFSIARWSSRLLGRKIQVSPMSGTWLRIHEADWNKHGADV